MCRSSNVTVLKHLRSFKLGDEAEEFLLTWGQHLGLLRLQVNATFLRLFLVMFTSYRVLTPLLFIFFTNKRHFRFYSRRRKQFVRGSLYGYTSPSVNSWCSVLIDRIDLQICEPSETSGHRSNKSAKFFKSRYLRLS